MKYISKLSVAICSALFVLGIVAGQIMYADRSKIVEKHVAGTNAITLHVLLTVVLGLIIAITIFYRRYAPKRPYSVWIAPFTKEASQRIRYTVLLKRGNAPSNIVRAIVVAFFTIVSLFYFYRAGIQATGSADPNFDTNAWGGPTRVGASLAHWMDAVFLFYIQASIIALFALKPKKHIAKKRSKK